MREAPERLPALALRFVAAYVILYTLPFPLSLIPGLPVGAWWNAALSPLAALAGEWIGLGAVSRHPTGSGDTAYSFAMLAVHLALAAIVTVVWVVVARRVDGRKVHDVTRTWLRYYLFTVMMGYGLAKVFPLQMPAPNAVRLTTTWGETSPMGLLWGFIGTSPYYEIWCGVGEVLGGLLMLTRRTTTAGALVQVAVMSNVVLLNYAYDVPVKLYSTHLLVFAVILLLPDTRRLIDLLIFNRSVPARDLSSPFGRTWPPRLGVVAVLLALVTLGLGVKRQRGMYTRMASGAMRMPLDGAWEVEVFVRGRDTIPALLHESLRWRRLAIGGGRSSVRFMNDSLVFADAVRDTATRTLSLFPIDTNFVRDSSQGALLQWTVPADGRLHLAGTWQGDSVAMDLVQRDLSRLRLTSRGFRWIQEYPYNR